MCSNKRHTWTPQQERTASEDLKTIINALHGRKIVNSTFCKAVIHAHQTHRGH